MSFETTSPNMLLPIPGVGLTSGPTYATDINSCLTLIDQHDHSPGSGVAIGASGLNIQSSLTLNSNDLTFVRSVVMNSQSAVLVGAADLDCIYVVGVDLYYNDGNGNNVRITQSGAVAGSPGSISNLTSPASASYASNTFTFQSAANVAASIDGRNFILRNSSANSKGLTLSPPAAMGADFGITLPSLPLVTSFLTISSSGAIGASTALSGGITGSMIASATITGANIGSDTVTADNIVDNPNFNGDAKSNSKYLVIANTNPGAGTLAIVRGKVDTGGSIIQGEGFTVSQGPQAGQYNIFYTTAFHSAPTLTASTDDGGGVHFVTLDPAPSASSCSIYTYNLAGTASAAAISFIAIGVKA